MTDGMHYNDDLQNAGYVQNNILVTDMQCNFRLAITQNKNVSSIVTAIFTSRHKLFPL